MIRIFPKSTIEDDTEELKDKVLISILSPIETSLTKECKDRYKDVLELRFEDLPYDPKQIPKIADWHTRVFDKTDYDLILSFLNKHKNTTDIDIHCGAGISRSSGVALGICFYYNSLPLLKETIKNSKYIHPNERILCYFRLLSNPHYGGLNIENIYSMINLKEEGLEIISNTEKIIKEANIIF